LPIFSPGNWLRRRGSIVADPALPLDAVLVQWRGLSTGDRKAILKRLPLERRIALEQALTADRVSQQPGRRGELAAYSPWLAEIVAACEKDESLPDGPRPAVRNAIRAAHAEIAAEPDEARRASLLDLTRSTLQRWGLWP
jgi:hypothetical protein